MVEKEENLDEGVEVSDSAFSIKLVIAIVITLVVFIFCIAVFMLRYYNMGILTIPFIFTIVIAMVSLFIALEANYNTRKMAQTNLHGVVRNAFTSRYTFFNEMHNLESKGNIITDENLNRLAKQHMEFATWDFVLCLKQANTLKKWASAENKNNLAQYLDILIDNVFVQKSKKILKNRHVEHLLTGCNLLIEIGVSKKFENSIIEKFEKHSTTKKKSSECFQDYVKRKLDEVKNDPDGKLETKEYIDELFIGFK